MLLCLVYYITDAIISLMFPQSAILSEHQLFHLNNFLYMSWENTCFELEIIFKKGISTFLSFHGAKSTLEGFVYTGNVETESRKRRLVDIIGFDTEIKIKLSKCMCQGTHISLILLLYVSHLEVRFRGE